MTIEHSGGNIICSYLGDSDAPRRRNAHEICVPTRQRPRNLGFIYGRMDLTAYLPNMKNTEFFIVEIMNYVLIQLLPVHIFCANRMVTKLFCNVFLCIVLENMSFTGTSKTLSKYKNVGLLTDSSLLVCLT